MAELVEREDTGQCYARTFTTNGHYLRQPVAGLAASICDSGVWLRGGERQHGYWYNRGAYRRRAGQFFPVV